MPFETSSLECSQNYTTHTDVSKKLKSSKYGLVGKGEKSGKKPKQTNESIAEEAMDHLFFKISAAQFIFAEPIQRFERNYKFPKKDSRIRQIHSLYYWIPPAERKYFQNRSNFSSNFVQISNPSEDTPCSVYHTVNEKERSDFSYTCSDQNKIQQFYAIRNAEITMNKENAILLVLYRTSKKDPDGSEKQLVCLSSISTDRMKLKPLFQFPNFLHPQASKLLAVNQKLRGLMTSMQDRTIPEYFELAILIEKGKILYSKTKPTGDWFNQLRDFHDIFLFDTKNIKEKDTPVGIVFDTSDSRPVRLLIATVCGNEYHFQVCIEEFSNQSQIKLVPECYFSTDEFAAKFPFTSNNMCTPPEVILNSNLKFIGVAGLAEANTESFSEFTTRLFLMDFFDSAQQKKIWNNHLQSENQKRQGKERIENLQLSLTEESSSYFIETVSKVFQKKEDFASELRTAHTEFEFEGTPVHLMVFGVTGSKIVHWLLIWRKKLTKVEVEHSHLATKVIEVRLAPDNKVEQVQETPDPKQPHSRPSSTKHHDYLNALGQSIHIEKFGASQYRARVNISFGATATFDLELEINKWMHL